MRTALVLALVAAACLTMMPAPRAQQQPPILQAMQEEMTRAMNGLRLGNEPRPYFIAYSVEDTTGSRVLAKFGSVLLATSPSKGRTLRVDVRVGDYNMDSSRIQTPIYDPSSLSVYGQYGASLAIDDDYDLIKHDIWLATDVAYKRAVQALSRKKANAQNRAADPEPVPDFSREAPAQTSLPMPAAPPVSPAVQENLRAVSAAFLAFPEIDSSEASLSETHGTRYYLNSEGFKVVEPIALATLHVVADTQAADGMALRDFLTVSGRTVNDLPPLADLLARTKTLAAGLVALRGAPIGDDFTGPVLVEGQAAPALLAQTLVPMFLSQRPPEIEGVAPAMIASRFPASPFLTRIGSRVLPEGFSIRDTPSVGRLGDVVLPGAYAVDDEGVPAKDVTLVEDGKLLTLLTSRVPQKGLLQSNGHCRGGGAQASVFQVASTRAVPAAELKAKYLEALKAQGRPFGYIVRGVADPAEMQLISEPLDVELSAIAGAGARLGPSIVQAVKVAADGSEQVVRGVTFANVQHTSYRNIAETSRERVIYTARGRSAMPGAAMSGRTPTVSLVVPSLLFEELEIQRVKQGQLKAPIVPSPLKK